MRVVNKITEKGLTFWHCHESLHLGNRFACSFPIYYKAQEQVQHAPMFVHRAPHNPTTPLARCIFAGAPATFADDDPRHLFSFMRLSPSSTSPTAIILRGRWRSAFSRRMVHLGLEKTIDSAFCPSPSSSTTLPQPLWPWYRTH